MTVLRYDRDMRSFVAVALVAACGLGLQGADAPAISTDNLRTHLQFLSSDEMRGRANGSPELERAAEYIARQFENAGLRPAGVDGWFQPFEVVAGLIVGPGNELSVSARGKTMRFALGTSYYPLGTPATGTLTRLEELDVVFAGYGISAPQADYDDYARLDVQGKAVVIFSHEPQERSTSSRLNGARPLAQTTLEAKAAAARDRGAKLLLVIGDPTHGIDQADYGLFVQDPDADAAEIPVLRIRRKEAQALADAFNLDARARQIDGDLVPRSGPLQGARISYTEDLKKNRQTVRNVVGVLPGSDAARRDQAIVIGAHYDHVGIGGHLSVSPERVGQIHNGADDNASGTSAIIEMARVASADRARFPRSLVFVAFAGEERGLLGSAHYTTVAPISIDSTWAMLNLDMVGRADGSVDISGMEASPSMEQDLKAASKAVSRLGIRREGPGAGRSDDSSFLDRRVPAINFFTGFHGDYHRPSDDWERVDLPGTSQVASLALELAASLAARDTKPEFVPPAKK
jgi:hypothetical protein